MRVVYACSLAAGGPLTHLLELAPGVARAGVDVAVVCATPEVAEEFRGRGVEADAAPLAHKLDLRGAARVRSLLAGADVVHTHDRRTGLLVRPQARALGAASVHTLHGVPDEVFGLVGRDDGRILPGVSKARAAWLVHGVLRAEAVLARLGTTVVPSEALCRFLAAHGFERSRMRVIPNGIETRRAEPSPRHEPLRIATAAVLEYRKGIDVLVDACARLDRSIRLDVFGDGTLRGDLEARARSLGVSATFHGAVPDVEARMADVDVFALPTRGDNLPIAVLEAMALALPVVATRTGGLPELVSEGESGLLVEPDDVGGLAEALGRLAADEELRLRLGRGGATRARDRFASERVVREFVALYRQVSDAC